MQLMSAIIKESSCALWGSVIGLTQTTDNEEKDRHVYRTLGSGGPEHSDGGTVTQKLSSFLLHI